MTSSRITPPWVLTVGLGLFFVVAALGTWIPSFIKDRYQDQFLPIMGYFAEVTLGTQYRESVGSVAAAVAQVLIGAAEMVGGMLLLVGAFSRTWRKPCLTWGYSLLTGLFAIFMLTIFLLHYVILTLPSWNQFPAILVMLLVTRHLMLKEEAVSSEHVQ